MGNMDNYVADIDRRASLIDTPPRRVREPIQQVSIKKDESLNGYGFMESELIIQKPSEEYEIEPPIIRQRIERIKELDSILKEKMCDSIVTVAEMGQLLKEQKKEHPGTFMNWVSKNFDFTHDTCNRYMRIADHFHEILMHKEFIESSEPSLQLAYDISTEIEQKEKEEKVQQIEHLIQIKETTGKNPEGWNVDCDYRLRIKKQEDQARKEREEKEKQQKLEREKQQRNRAEFERKREEQRIKDEAKKLLKGQGIVIDEPPPIQGGVYDTPTYGRDVMLRMQVILRREIFNISNKSDRLKTIHDLIKYLGTLGAETERLK